MIQKLANWFDSLTFTARSGLIWLFIIFSIFVFFFSVARSVRYERNTSYDYFTCIDNNKSIRKESLSSGMYIKEYPCEQYLPKK